MDRLRVRPVRLVLFGRNIFVGCATPLAIRCSGIKVSVRMMFGTVQCR